jgi:hypothetical protein
MSHTSKALDIDVRGVFLRAFLVTFAIFEFFLLYRLRRLPLRMPRNHPVFGVFLLVTLRSLLFSLILAGLIAVLLLLVVRLVARPLLSIWLRPVADPSAGLFHLAASETIIASVPARRKSRWVWQPGALVLTNRRIWFIPSAWDSEPSSVELGDVENCELQLPACAGIGLVTNWPPVLKLLTRHESRWTIAVRDPEVVLEWLARGQSRQGKNTAATPIKLGQGAFDV